MGESLFYWEFKKMNCNCLSHIESRMKAYMQPKAGDDCTVAAASTAFVLADTGLKYVLQIPFCVKGPKKGFSSAKGKSIGCNVTLCPFCGRPAGRYTVGADAGIEAAMMSKAAGHSEVV